MSHNAGHTQRDGAHRGTRYSNEVQFWLGYPDVDLQTARVQRASRSGRAELFFIWEVPDEPPAGGPQFKEPGTLDRLADGLNLIEGKTQKLKARGRSGLCDFGLP